MNQNKGETSTHFLLAWVVVLVLKDKSEPLDKDDVDDEVAGVVVVVDDDEG